MGETVRQAARATRQLALAVGLTAFSFAFVTVLLITAIGVVAVVGVWLLPETVLLIRRIAGAKRSMAGAWTGTAIPDAYRPITGPIRARLRTAVRDPGTFVDSRWMLANYGYGLLGLLAVPLWAVGLPVDGVWSGLLRRRPVVLPLIGRLADLDATWSAALLKPSPQALLALRVEQLTQTRAEAIAAHSAELRRIERDLHDGAQARLVALSMRIGLAKRAYERDPAAGRRLLDEAQQQTEEALAELRHVVRGIHPPILTDRGLAGAVRALAAGSGLDVTVRADDLDGGPRAPVAVESAAYYVVAEALTNAARHSGSRQAAVDLARTRAGLRVTVRDEGKGGAGPAADGARASDREDSAAGGTGLDGMRRRVAALDGTFTLNSPVGGPTVIEAELPCAW
jgi:signal transduction histidine kinase